MKSQVKYFNDSEKYAEYVSELETQAKEALDKVKRLSMPQKKKLINLVKEKFKETERFDYLGNLSVSKKLGAIFENYSSEAQSLISLINTINLVYPNCP